MVKAVVGANWGDEGKGKITDMLAREADIIVRFQGGANAGHTIVNDYGKFALHTLPSGVFYGHTTSIIGNGVALDVPRLFAEVQSVVEKGVPMPKILVSDRAQMVMSYHKNFDAYEEERLGGKSFGSTKSGIAPFYSDKYAKIGFQVSELFDEELLKEKVVRVAEQKNVLLEHLYHKPLINPDELYNELMEYKKMVEPYVANVSLFLHEALKEGKTILLEGQLGSMKDPDHGIYPMVTSSSTLAGWNWAASRMESFDENAIDPAYPSLRHNWCVLVAASEGWANYRHQADVYAMYQLMKRHGYDDDHIILVAEDDIAWNPKNLYPGVVRVHRDGGNVYDGIRIDYRLDDLKPEDLEAILAGEAGGRTPYVVTGDEHTNVFLFWSGHGVYNGLNWGEGYEMLRGQQLGKMIRKAYERGNYRKMFVALEACYGGSMAEACKGIPGVVFMTAANAGETSKADVQDYEMNIWLSNGFTRAFQETIDANPSISLRDLYYKLARNTVGSHVSVYNEALYGNIFRNTMSEYLRE